MPDAWHICCDFPCAYCGPDSSPLYSNREQWKQQVLQTKGEKRRLEAERKEKKRGLEAELPSKDTAIAVGLPLQCDNSSKDQESAKTPVESGEAFTSLWKGFSYRPDQVKFVAEIRPPHPVWKKEKKKIGLGSYPTDKGAARAYDVGIFYTRKSVPYNISSPAVFVQPFPNNLSFDKIKDVTPIRQFMQKEAYAFVRKFEKAKAPCAGISLLLAKDGDELTSLEDIDSPPSIGSTLPIEDDNEVNQDTYEPAANFFPECSRRNAEVSAPEHPWVQSYLASLPDPSQDDLDHPELHEEGV